MKPSPAIAFLGPATCVVLALLIAPLALLARDSLNKYGRSRRRTTSAFSPTRSTGT